MNFYFSLCDQLINKMDLNQNNSDIHDLIFNEKE